MDKETHSSKNPGTSLAWEDPTQARAWFTTLRDQVLDALAAGEDATRPLRERVLSRAEARRKILAADKNITSLLAAAERGLPPERDE